MTTQHDLIFFEKRSTPKVMARGKSFIAPESYGKQTKRRPATPEEEKQIARGDWVRVDEHGTKGGQPGYKKTRMAGREHLVKHFGKTEEESMSDLIGLEKPSLDDVLDHSGVKGMKWGVRKEQKAASLESVQARTDHPLAKLRSPYDQARMEKKAAERHGGTPRSAKEIAAQDKADRVKSRAEKLSRKEKKAKISEEQHAFYEKKLNNILDVASKDSESLIALKTQHDAVIVTGEQFLNHVKSGGVLDARLSDVYATRNRDSKGRRTGPYVLNQNINAPFRPSK